MLTCVTLGNVVLYSPIIAASCSGDVLLVLVNGHGLDNFRHLGTQNCTTIHKAAVNFALFMISTPLARRACQVDIC
jgi:hypothetical protein